MIHKYVLSFYVCVLLTLMFDLFSIAPVWAQEEWKELAKGLHLYEFATQSQTDILTVLRIDPHKYRFVLCNASNGSVAKEISQWGKEKGLIAATNASMYLKDRQTSTGYMRHDTHINNPKVGRKFGAFFVANPDIPTLPHVDILEGKHEVLEDILTHYTLVIQNYRLITKEQNIPWPKVGKKHPISAVGIDTDGFVFFFFCKTPILPHDFAKEIINFHSTIRTTMYVEGGAEAVLFFVDNDKKPTCLFPLFEPILPNVLGVVNHTMQ